MGNLPEHGHCENCGDPIKFDEHFCSDACSNEYEADVKEARKLDKRFYTLMGVGVIVAAVGAFLVKYFILN
jgi:predicted nucleic acid-binding Zn ribbon protein